MNKIRERIIDVMYIEFETTIYYYMNRKISQSLYGQTIRVRLDAFIKSDIGDTICGSVYNKIHQ